MAELTIWNGSQWRKPTIRVWNGSQWVVPSAIRQFRNGTWVDIHSTITLRGGSIDALGSFRNRYAIASYTLRQDGVAIGLASPNGNSSVGQYNWGPSTGSSGYEVLATRVSGIINGVVGTWQNLGTTRVWTVEAHSPNTGPGGPVLEEGVYSFGHLRLQIRPVGGAPIGSPVDVYLSAEVP